MLKNADAMIVAAEWNEFKGLDFKKVKAQMKNPVIFDGRNMYDPKKINNAGIKYVGIGR